MRLGRRAAEDGNKDTARMIFNQVLDIDMRHIGAWMWLAYLADSRPDQRQYLQQVLQIDPNNQKAKAQLQKLDRELASADRSSLGIGVSILILMVAAVLVVGGLLFVVSRLV
jgi:ferric-dicitrate binding protein FerR (iron transport regulator)